jgi:glycosyltransferase involved in cell wall biosynthesis
MTDHAHPRGPVLRWIQDQILKGIYQRCAKILYIGQRSLSHFQRLGCPPEKLVYSPYCVDTAAFQWDEAARVRLRPLIRQQLGLTDRDKAILFSGKLSHRKGVDLLLQAVKTLPHALRQETTVLIMGNGSLKDYLIRLARKSPPVSVQFLGFQNQTALSPYYLAADLLVLPSRHSETWGLVVNEALHHGLPCIVSEAVGCAPDLIEPGATGEIFPTGSVEGLACAIQRALLLIGAPKVRDQCRAKVSGFIVEKAAEGISRAFHDILRT